MQLPKVTLLYAGLLGLFYIALTVNVIRQRVAKKTGIGHSVDPECPLFRAVRIHGNFAEYVPFVLILLALDEMTGRAPFTLHALGLSLLVGRATHYIGITKTHKTSIYRKTGMILTFVCLLSLSVSLIIKGLHEIL